ncbi:MAG: hypothetical protein ACTSUE_06720 [Promethearchaeota archaeon]
MNDTSDSRKYHLSTNQINYDLELSREVKKKIQFFIKELSVLENKEDVDKILGEVLFISATTPDVKIRSYIHRKLRQISQERPDMINF